MCCVAAYVCGLCVVQPTFAAVRTAQPVTLSPVSALVHLVTMATSASCLTTVVTTKTTMTTTLQPALLVTDLLFLLLM